MHNACDITLASWTQKWIADSWEANWYVVTNKLTFQYQTAITSKMSPSSTSSKLTLAANTHCWTWSFLQKLKQKQITVFHNSQHLPVLVPVQLHRTSPLVAKTDLSAQVGNDSHILLAVHFYSNVCNCFFCSLLRTKMHCMSYIACWSEYNCVGNSTSF